MTPKSLYRFFAIGEACTWALLISGLIARFISAELAGAVTVTGSIHGAMFLSYCTVSVIVGVNQRWKFGRIASAVALAIVPFATVPFDRSLMKRGSLEGSWRTTDQGVPSDKSWFDRLFRWFIARPLILIATLLLALAALFSFLLFLGSPTQWFD